MSMQGKWWAQCNKGQETEESSHIAENLLSLYVGFHFYSKMEVTGVYYLIVYLLNIIRDGSLWSGQLK